MNRKPKPRRAFAVIRGGTIPWHETSDDRMRDRWEYLELYRLKSVAEAHADYGDEVVPVVVRYEVAPTRARGRGR